MAMRRSAGGASQSRSARHKQLSKCPTGIHGLDEVTQGGLPRGRPTLVAGMAGSGKTLMATEFLVNGATDYNEPGVFMAFEESAEELAANVQSLGWDLKSLIRQRKLIIDQVRINPSEIEETGEYDLEGLFVRLGHHIDKIKAKRVVLDTIEVLFAGFESQSVIRSELQRLFRWLKERGVTAIITGEHGESNLTRHGLEEYVSDCVLALDHRVNAELSTRRLRIVKYRGSAHGTNEYPFMIDQDGFSVLPVTSMGLNHPANTGRISSGIKCLDEMLGGKGYIRGSTVLVSGMAGTGKTSLASAFAAAACKRGEKTLCFTFEESPQQVMHHMKSIGMNLMPMVKKGLLHYHAARPARQGFEQHLVTMHRIIEKVQPKVVIVDPMSSFTGPDSRLDATSFMTRLIDYLKTKGITGLFTSLSYDGEPLESTHAKVSSLMDAWLLLRDVELDGERNRLITIIKARGIGHSKQCREFVLSDKGIDLVDVYLGEGQVLVGTARATAEARSEADRAADMAQVKKAHRTLEVKRQALEAQIASLRAEHELNELHYVNLSDKRKRQLNASRTAQDNRSRLRGGTKKNATRK